VPSIFSELGIDVVKVMPAIDRLPDYAADLRQEPASLGRRSCHRPASKHGSMGGDVGLKVDMPNGAP